jgi:serine/threonine protein kinase
MVFSEALDLPREERAAYLERACGGRSALRERVEALLASHDRLGDFLEQSPQTMAAQSRVAAASGEGAGDRIGGFKLLQQIGEGGCGVVHMAEQEEPVRRRVALKIIKPGMDTKSVIARFEAERQALALMDHPNIARVFEAGATAAGRPFFVMELVRGVKITDFCDRHALTTVARLGLFLQVCDAVQHAHQKGIIHRDIKPSNILVTTSTDGTGLPKVIDFGIAKATTGQRLTDKTLFTAFEMLIGTPAYMSPEQAALSSVDVDTRTDIYSLGVLLYELLTGTTPFDTSELLKAGFDEVRRVITNQEPVRPSTRLSTMMAPALTGLCQRHQADPAKLIRAVRGDLDWIVMKALEKDRARRYETAHSLARDVQRYLANEPISARPPSSIYKVQKLVSRNRLFFGSLAVILLLIAVSLALVTISLAKERRARQEADAALRQAKADQAKALIEGAKSQQVTHFLEDMLEGVGPSVARGRDTKVLKEILDHTAQRVGQELTNQPAVEAELRTVMGHVYLRIGEFRRAEEMDRGALARAQLLYGLGSREAAAARHDLGEALLREGNSAEAESAFVEALDVRRRLLGNESGEVAASLSKLADVYRVEHRFADAEAREREALAIRQKLFGSESLEAADSMRNLSIVLNDEGKPIESEAMTREILAIRQKLLGSEHPLVAASLDDVAWAAGVNGKLAEAQTLEGDALAMKRKLLGDEHPDVARSLFLLGQRLQTRGLVTDSAWVLGAALSIQRKLLGDDHPDTLYTLRNLSWALEAESKWPEAEMADRAALASWRKMFGNESAQAVSALDDLARVLMAQKKFAETEQLLTETLTPEFLAEPGCVKLLLERVDLAGRRGRWREAAADAALVLKYMPDDHYRYHTLAPLLVRLQDAAGYQQLCRTIRAKFPATSNPYVAERVVKDCLLLPDSGSDLSWADHMADAAMDLGKTDPSMPFFQTAKAMSTYRQSRFAESAQWAERARHSSQVYAQAQAQACAFLAMAQWQLGQREAARETLQQGEKLVPAMEHLDDGGDIGAGWVAWLVARISLDEAKGVLRAGAAPRSAPAC